MKNKFGFKFYWIIPLTCVIFAWYWAQQKSQELMVSQEKKETNFQLQNFMGHWYEIAHLPSHWQKNCYCTQSYFYLPSEDSLTYLINNTCRYGSKDGNIEYVSGKGWSTDEDISKHKHQYYWPITGNIWIDHIAEDGSWVIMGHPTREYIWIMSRTPTIKKILLDELILLSRKNGYPVDRIIMTDQDCGNNFEDRNMV